MTPDTEKPFDALPICACAEFYDSHPPDCPVRRHIEQQSAEIARLRRGLEAIRTHMETISPTGCRLSTTWAIANNFLSAQPGEKQS